MAEGIKVGKRVLVTGSPGAGKSALCELARQEGHSVIDTDDPRILSWGKKGLPSGASLLYLLRNSPKFDWNELERRFDEDGKALAYGAVPPMPRQLMKAVSYFDRIEYLILSPIYIAKRLKDRKGNPFGTTPMQVASSIVDAMVLNSLARVASFIDRGKIRVHDAMKEPRQLLSDIYDGQRE